MSLKCETIVFDFIGLQIYLIFRLSTNFINHNDETGGGACGVMIIVVGIGHGDTSSNPGRDWLHFT